jgi:predicted Rossmann-fold nucleotide-binding protein
MLKRIVSGGQTGADRAALDVALTFDIPHGGWIPRGRKTEDGPLPTKYKLKELTTTSYPKRTEQNVIDSDGTVIFTHGALTGGSKLTKKFAEKHNKPCLHIDLYEIPSHNVGLIIRAWMHEYKIEMLNVAGSRDSKDPMIYRAVFDIISDIYWMDKIKGEMSDRLNKESPRNKTNGKESPKPKTVDEAIDKIIEDMKLFERSKVANFTEGQLAILELVTGRYISDMLEDWSIGVNKELMEDCIAKSEKKSLDEVQAATVILKEMWKRLRQTHKLRVVK